MKKLSTWDNAFYPKIYINYTDGQTTVRRDGKSPFCGPVIINNKSIKTADVH